MWRRLLDSALRHAVYPLTIGSSATVTRNLSSSFLNSIWQTPVKFRRSDGRVLNNLGPSTQKLPSRRRWSLFLVDFATGGTRHNLPNEEIVFRLSDCDRICSEQYPQGFSKHRWFGTSLSFFVASRDESFRDVPNNHFLRWTWFYWWMIFAIAQFVGFLQLSMGSKVVSNSPELESLGLSRGWALDQDFLFQKSAKSRSTCFEPIDRCCLCVVETFHQSS